MEIQPVKTTDRKTLPHTLLPTKPAVIKPSRASFSALVCVLSATFLNTSHHCRLDGPKQKGREGRGGKGRPRGTGDESGKVEEGSEGRVAF